MFYSLQQVLPFSSSRLHFLFSLHSLYSNNKLQSLLSSNDLFHSKSDMIGLPVLLKGKDATEEFEDAGHSKSARELMEKFCVGELDTSTTTAIPELEIVRKGQSGNLPGKILNLTKQYWAVSVAVVGIAVVVSVFCLRRK